MPGPESTPTGAAEEAAQENQEQAPAVAPVETPLPPVAENPAPTEITKQTPPVKKEKGQPYHQAIVDSVKRRFGRPGTEKILDREENYSKSESIDQLINEVLSGELENRLRQDRTKELQKNGYIGQAGSYLSGEGRWVLNRGTGQMELQDSIFDYNPDDGTLVYNAGRDITRRAASVGAKIGAKGAITAGIGIAVGLVTGGVGLAPIAAMTGKSMLGSGLGRGGVEAWRHLASREREYLQKIESADIRYFQKARELASRVLLYMPPYGEVGGFQVPIDPDIPLGQEDSDLRTQPITNNGRQSPPYPDKNPDIGEAVSNLTKTEYEQARYQAITDLVNFVHSYEQLSFIDDNGARKIVPGEETKEPKLDANSNPINPPVTPGGPTRIVGADGGTVLPLNDATFTAPQVNRPPGPESNLTLEVNQNPYAGPPLRGVELQQTSPESVDFEKIRDLWDKYLAEKSMWEQRSEKGELIGGLSFLAMNLLSGAWEKMTGKLYQELGDRLQAGDVVNRINTDSRWWIRHPIELLRNSDQLVYHFKSVGEQLASQAAGATQALSETGGKIGEFGGHLLGKTGLAVDYGLLNRAQELVGTQVAAAVASMFARFGIGNAMRKRNEEMMNEHRERNVHNDERQREQRQPDEPESLLERVQKQATERMRSYPQVDETWAGINPDSDSPTGQNYERFKILELIEDKKNDRMLVKIALKDPKQKNDSLVEMRDWDLVVDNFQPIIPEEPIVKSEVPEEKTNEGIKVKVPNINVKVTGLETEEETAKDGGEDGGGGSADTSNSGGDGESKPPDDNGPATGGAAAETGTKPATQAQPDTEATTQPYTDAETNPDNIAVDIDLEKQRKVDFAKSNGCFYQGKVVEKGENAVDSGTELMRREMMYKGTTSNRNIIIEQNGRFFKVMSIKTLDNAVGAVEVDNKFQEIANTETTLSYDQIFDPKKDTYFYSPEKPWQSKDDENGTQEDQNQVRDKDATPEVKPAGADEEPQENQPEVDQPRAEKGEETTQQPLAPEEPPSVENAENSRETYSIKVGNYNRFSEDVTRSLYHSSVIHLIDPGTRQDHVVDLENSNPMQDRFAFSGDLNLTREQLINGGYRYYIEKEENTP
ncbi:MAG: hypothetical protein AAB881_01805 [Patescibacteria group bacterium]